MKWTQSIAKAGRFLLRWAITRLAYVDHRVYMRVYVPFLSRLGVVMNGKPRYIAARVRMDGTDFSLIELGEDVVISSDVRILTHDFSIARVNAALGHGAKEESVKLAPVRIGANSFVGAFSVLLPGTTIGRDCIIGAGSVVRGEIPDGAITLGNPAHVVASVYGQRS